MVRTPHHPHADELQLEAVLHALSDPVRLQIVAKLADEPEERPCGTLHCHLAKSTMTHHFKVLREAGVIAQRDEGTSRLTRLRRDDLDVRFPGLLDAVLRGVPKAAADRQAAPPASGEAVAGGPP